MIKEILIILIVVLLISSLTFASTSIFLDVDGNSKYYDAIMDLYNKNIMLGYEDEFKPNNNVTRAELAATLNNLMKYVEQNKIENKVLNVVTNNMNRTVRVIAGGDLGTGVIIDNHHILTACHIGIDNIQYQIIFSDGSATYAHRIAIDIQEDIKLLQFETPIEIDKIKFGNQLTKGETVVTIGNPLKLNFSVSKGVVSNTDIEVSNQIVNSIDMDANNGNSGGGLFNTDGELVGILVSKVKPEKGNGLCFAVTPKVINNFLKIIYK